MILVKSRMYFANGNYVATNVGVLLSHYPTLDIRCLNNCIVRSSDVMSRFVRPTTKCNIMLFENGKLISYKKLKDIHPDAFTIINSLPSI